MRGSNGLCRIDGARFVAAKRARRVFRRGRQKDDRHVRRARAAAHQRCKLEAVHAGHVDVEDRERGFMLEQQVERGRARVRDQQLDPRTRQQRFERRDVMRDIVDDQNVDG
jgi:hypothetical protein